MRNNFKRYKESGGTSRPIEIVGLTCPRCQSKNLELADSALMDCGHMNYVYICLDCHHPFVVAEDHHLVENY